jgi:hypothetical protein
MEISLKKIIKILQRPCEPLWPPERAQSWPGKTPFLPCTATVRALSCSPFPCSRARESSGKTATD